jgi:serine/threonine-protein kinase
MNDSAMFHGQRAIQLLPTSRDAFDALFLLLDWAEILVIFGENEAAISQLEYMLSIPGFLSKHLLILDPLWEPLRDHPRFRALHETFDNELGSK